MFGKKKKNKGAIDFKEQVNTYSLELRPEPSDIVRAVAAHMELYWQEWTGEPGVGFRYEPLGVRLSQVSSGLMSCVAFNEPLYRTDLSVNDMVVDLNSTDRKILGDAISRLRSRFAAKSAEERDEAVQGVLEAMHRGE